MAPLDLTADHAAIRKLRKLGIDVTQLADEPLPGELWDVIAIAVDGLWGKNNRWFAAAAMYGRFLTVLKSGGTATELAEQFGPGRSLAPLLATAEMRELVLAANLPGTLNGWLAEVVRRTRLTRSEKLSLAGDLIDQCHSGLSTGQTPAEIITRLGEARPAACRLRREKLKQRAWWVKSFRRTCRIAVAGFLFFTLLITWLLYRYYGVHPAAAPDEIERFDARAAAIPVADRAWPLYAAGFGKLDLPPTDHRPNRQQHINLMYEACEAGPQHVYWSEAAEHIARNRPAIDLFLEAAARPKLGYIRRDPANNDWLRKLNHSSVDQTFQKRPRHEIILPEVSALQHARRLLIGAAHEAAAAGDRRRAFDCVAALTRLAHHVWAEEETPVSRLNALNYLDSATRTLSLLFAKHIDDCGDDELLHVLHDLQPRDQGWRDELLAGTQQSRRQYLTDMYSADGRFTREGFEGLCTLPIKAPQLAWLTDLIQWNAPTRTNNTINVTLMGPLIVPLVASRDDMLKQFDELSELYEADLRTHPTGVTTTGAYDQEFDRLLESKRTQVRYLPLAIETRPAWLTAAAEGRWKKTVERDGLRVAIACHLYHRRHAAWPESVAALVPEYLETAPIDPTDGKPLHIAVIKDRLFVYSVGLDRKDATATAAGKLKEVDPRDWQLFPPLDPAAGAEPASDKR